jgi:hypothetical protein
VYGVHLHCHHLFHCQVFAQYGHVFSLSQLTNSRYVM